MSTYNQFLKARLKDNPDYEPTYIEKRPPSWKKMRKQFGLGKLKLRGRGWTRPFKNTSKKERKQSQASRRRNRK